MTNLSSLPGFSSGSSSSGGGGGGTTDSLTFLDAKSYDLKDENKYLNVTNMNSYFQTFRIRGMDTSTKAYVGTNCMVQNGSGGNMQHVCTLFEIDQATGAIAKKQVTVMHNNGSSTSDYSTYTKTGDEWTGRYTYHGHIPCNSQGHNYSYHQCYLYNTSGSKSSNHTSRSSYMPAGNDQTHNSYVAPNERRLGGGVRHFLAAYDSSSKGHPLEFFYDYHSSNYNPSRTDSKPYSTSETSTTYQVTMFHQWDSSNEPYFDAFMTQQEGLYCHRRSQVDWQNKGTDMGFSDRLYSFTLSNGNMLFGNGSTHWLVNSSGTFTVVSSSNILAPMSLAVKDWAHFCWNVGEDEWLLNIPGGRFLKFKINPSNGYISISNMLKSNSVEMSGFSDSFQQEKGFWGFSNSARRSGYMATFGTENSNGPGYGQSKLVHVAGVDSPQRVVVATWDIAALVTELTYS